MRIIFKNNTTFLIMFRRYIRHRQCDGYESLRACYKSYVTNFKVKINSYNTNLLKAWQVNMDMQLKCIRTQFLISGASNA